MGYFQKLKSFINAYSLDNLIAHCESFTKNFTQSSVGGGGIFVDLIWILFLFAVTIFLNFLYFLKEFFKNISKLLKNVFKFLRALLTISMGEISIYWEYVNSLGRALKVDFENIIENMIVGIENLYGKIIEDTYEEKNTAVFNSHPINTLFLMLYWIFLFVLSIAMSILLIVFFLTPFPFLHQSIRRLIFGVETVVSKNSSRNRGTVKNAPRSGLPSRDFPNNKPKSVARNQRNSNSTSSAPEYDDYDYLNSKVTSKTKDRYISNVDIAHDVPDVDILFNNLSSSQESSSQIENDLRIENTDNERIEEHHSNIPINQELSSELAVQYYQNETHHQTLNKYTQGYYSATLESLTANRRYSAIPLELTESSDYNGLFWIIKTSENYFLMFPNPKMRIDQSRIHPIQYFFSINFRDSNYVACEVIPADMKYENDKWKMLVKGRINLVY